MSGYSILLIAILFVSCQERKSETTIVSSGDTVVNRSDNSSPSSTASANKPLLNDTTIRPAQRDQSGATTPNGKYSGTCYLQTSGNDSVRLHITINGTNVSGQMQFDNYQIDGSSGSVNGKVAGDIIQIWYHGRSEGQQFKRQIWFKQSDDRLLWGKGSQITRNDSSFYTDPAKITYSSILFLREMPCDDVVIRMK